MVSLHGLSLIGTSVERNQRRSLTQNASICARVAFGFNRRKSAQSFVMIDAYSRQPDFLSLPEYCLADGSRSLENLDGQYIPCGIDDEHRNRQEDVAFLEHDAQH